MTGYALAGLERCRRMGLTVEETPLARGRAAAVTLLAAAEPSAKALLLAALALGERAEPAAMNAMYRVREDLPTSAAALLAIAHHVSGDAAKAGALTAILRSRAKAELGLVHWEAAPSAGWLDGEVESTAIAGRPGRRRTGSARSARASPGRAPRRRPS